LPRSEKVFDSRLQSFSFFSELPNPVVGKLDVNIWIEVSDKIPTASSLPVDEVAMPKVPYFTIDAVEISKRRLWKASSPLLIMMSKKWI
jgi:hypothetical protein